VEAALGTALLVTTQRDPGRVRFVADLSELFGVRIERGQFTSSIRPIQNGLF
jgi:hypothetical protein